MRNVLIVTSAVLFYSFILVGFGEWADVYKSWAEQVVVTVHVKGAATEELFQALFWADSLCIQINS